MDLRLPFDIPPKASGLFLVGGAVRDLVNGQQPIDYDIVTASDPAGLARELSTITGRRLIQLGKPGQVVFRIIGDQWSTDISALKGTSIEHDLAARDFTINAIAYDLTSGCIIDPTGGLKDLRHGLIRMINDEAFENDPLRLLRAYRISAAMGFVIDSQTCQAIFRHAHQINMAAGERVWSELQAILSSPDSFSQIDSMAASGLLEAVFPELSPGRGCSQNQHHAMDVFNHSLTALQALENIITNPLNYMPAEVTDALGDSIKKKANLLKLACLLHDIGKPAQRTVDEQGGIHFFSHAGRSAIMAGSIVRRLRLSKRHQEWVVFIIRNHQYPLNLFLAEKYSGLIPRARGRFFRKSADYAPFLLIHAMADTLGKASTDQTSILGFLRGLLEDYIYKVVRLKRQPSLVNGKELIASFGLKPSPRLGALLKGIAELRLAGIITNRAEALHWVAAQLNHIEESESVMKKAPYLDEHGRALHNDIKT